MTETLPLYLRRKLAGNCVRCGDPADPDANLCRPHLEEQRARTRASMSKRRDLLRKARKCIDCTKPSRKLRCRPCHKRKLVADAERGGVNTGALGVHTSGDDHPDPTWRRDSEGWMRYRGQAKRGRQETAALDEQDIAYALDAILKAQHGQKLTQTPQVRELPRIQREAAAREWLALLDLAERFFDDVRRRHKIEP